MILSSTVALRLILTNWLCSSLITLPLASAIIDETLTSSPGLSGRRTDTVNILLLCTRPCCTTDDIVITSILPPERIETIFLFLTSRYLRAATVKSPEFSTIILWFSTISRKATIKSSSGTVIISSIFLERYGNNLLPGVLTAVPSAIVFTVGSVTTFLAFKDS